MLAYYLDEPLSAEEMPANDTELSHALIIKHFEDMLNKIGVPAETQSCFILPKGGLSWGMLLQIAFKNVSNYYPFVVQPWEMGDDRIYKRRERIPVTYINSAMSA